MSATKKKLLTQDQLGRRYGVTGRTIRTWEQLGAPLYDRQRMLEWIKERPANNGIFGSEPSPLPEGIEHTNLLRALIEDAAAHYLWFAFTVSHDRYIEQEMEAGRTKDEAEQHFFLFYYIMGRALKDWTESDAYNANAMEGKNPSLDAVLKALIPTWRERSMPPAELEAKQVPAPILAAMKARGKSFPEKWNFCVTQDENHH